MVQPETERMQAALTDVWHAYLDAAQQEYERSKSQDAGYPHFTEGDRWTLLPAEATSRWIDDVYEHGNWTAGFWFGVMWLLALGRGDDAPAALARRRLAQLAPRSLDSTTHDLGFLFYPAFTLGHELRYITPGDAAPALRAAEMLVRRFNERGGYIQAFGPIGDFRSAGTSTIDTMMNLPLLWWAASAGGDPSLFTIARRHARTSARLFFRDDGSTYHLNRYDPTSGALQSRGTFQGAENASCWSRGQAWAICGFAWSFAATGEPELLDAADRAANYFWDRLPADGVPPWDFTDHSIDAPRDASAAAIAALGALILGVVHLDETSRSRYAARGENLLVQLGASCLNCEREKDGILLRSCYSKPHGLGIDGAVAWGDFFFGVALALAVHKIPLQTALAFQIAGRGTMRSCTAHT